MLVIRRRAGQSIRIGDEIEIHVAEISPTKVTMAIRAPRNISVSRAELTLTKEQNLLAADSVSPGALARLTAGFPGRIGESGAQRRNRVQDAAGGSDMRVSGRNESKPPRQDAG
jgi:carbon storage regulator